MIPLLGNWWMFVLRGVIAILFGIAALFYPGMALLTLVFLFGVYAVLDGVFAFGAGIRRGRAHERHWIPLLIEGMLGIAAGIIAFLLPAVTVLALLVVIGVWAVVTGIFEAASAIRLRRHIRGEWLLLLDGVLSIVFGILILVFPAVGLFALIVWIGAFALITGICLIALGFMLRHHHHADHGSLNTGFPAVT